VILPTLPTLPTLELIGGLFVFVQALLTLPAVYRLRRDKQVRGMSIWTMSFYCFVSWYYVPILWVSGLRWTTAGLVVLGTVEFVWCVWAALLSRNS